MSESLRILFVPEASILAHVGRTLSVADALPAEAHDVSFACDGRHVGHVDRAGYQRHGLFTSPRAELLGRLKRGGSAFDEATLLKYVAAEVSLLEEVRPHLVVGDFRPSLAISTSALGLPYVCITNAVWTPFVSFSLDPPASWLPTRILGKRILRALRPLLEGRVFAGYAAPFNRVAAEYDVAPRDDVRKWMCSNECTLLADVPDFFPTSNLPDHFRYVGPVFWEPAEDVPRWLDELQSGRAGRIVYLTMGSTGPEGDIRRIAGTLLDEGHQVVCTSGSQDADFMRDLSDRFYCAPLLPGRKLCALADVVVCHGGNGTIYQALSQGTPVVGVPEFHDQDFNLQRVESLGLGRAAGSASSVINAVRDVLTDESYTRRAESFKRKLDEWNGPRDAAAAIMEFSIGLSKEPKSEETEADVHPGS